MVEIVKNAICQELRIPVTNENEKYLGVLTTMVRKKKALFGYMKDILKQRMKG